VIAVTEPQALYWRYCSRDKEAIMMMNFTDRFGAHSDISPLGYAMLFVGLIGLAWVLSGS